MKKMSIRKISILGLVLMAASAVTAAIIPAKSESKKANDGTLRNGAGDTSDGYTCLAKTGGGNECTLNDSGGVTSAAANQSSNNAIGQDTFSNTSQDMDGYNTSNTM